MVRKEGARRAEARRVRASERVNMGSSSTTFHISIDSERLRDCNSKGTSVQSCRELEKRYKQSTNPLHIYYISTMLDHLLMCFRIRFICSIITCSMINEFNHIFGENWSHLISLLVEFTLYPNNRNSLSLLAHDVSTRRSAYFIVFKTSLEHN